jgi:hypothetical protein
LPFVRANYVSAPDLVVEQIVVSTGSASEREPIP